MSAAAADAPLATEVAAVTVEGSDAGEGSDLSARERTELARSKNVRGWTSAAIIAVIVGAWIWGAAGQCSRGQVFASVNPNVPFQSLRATVIDVRLSGRIPRDYVFFVDAVRGEVIDGHFDAGDHCTLRLVGPRGPMDPVSPNRRFVVALAATEDLAEVTP